MIATWDTMLALLDGRLNEASEKASEAWAMGLPEESDAQERFGVSGVLMAQEVAIRTLRGGMAELVPILQVALERTPWGAVRCAFVSALADADRLDEARSELGDLSRKRFAAVPRDALWPLSSIAITEAIKLCGDTRTAGELYEELEPLKGLCEPGPYGGAVYGSIDRSLGMLAAQSGRYEDAFEHFAVAMQLNASLASPAWVARTAADYAETLQAEGSATNVAKAAELRRSALPAAESCGMTATIQKLTV
jgi:tetratricopeptide (TPR) repeat protein